MEGACHWSSFLGLVITLHLRRSATPVVASLALRPSRLWVLHAMMRGVVCGQVVFVVGSMAPRCQLLSVGFVAGADRLDRLLHFLAEQGVQTLEDLIGGPPLASEVGAELIVAEDIVFLEKVFVGALFFMRLRAVPCFRRWKQWKPA